ncbi:hypothetical protein ABTM16_19945, partial [Acinetobacter baumannii]
MRRIVSVCLPQWPIERMLSHRLQTRGDPGSAIKGRPDRERLFGLVEAGPRGVRLSAVNEAARQLGICAGDGLADARAM